MGDIIDDIYARLSDYMAQIDEEGDKPGEKLKDWINSDAFDDDIDDCFEEVDGNGNGKLTWNEGEIRDFIHAVFKKCGLPQPRGDSVFYGVYQRFDVNGSNALNEDECCSMVKGIVKAIYKHDGGELKEESEELKEEKKKKKKDKKEKKPKKEKKEKE